MKYLLIQARKWRMFRLNPDFRIEFYKVPLDCTHHTVPARSACDRYVALSISLVKTAAARP